MEYSVQAKRIAYIDIMRGIGIILVIIGHTYTPFYSKYFICSFHMPLFFLISGYLYKSEGEASSFKKYFINYANKLLLPYWITSVCIILFKTIVSFIKGEGIVTAVTTWLVAAIYGLPGIGLPMTDGIQRIGAIWFLEAMFWAEIELYLIFRIKRKKLRLAVILILNLFVVLVSQVIWLPLNIGTGIASCTFIYIGYLIKQSDLNNITSVKTLSMGVCWIICIVVAAIRNQPFVLAYLQYPLFGLDIVGGVAGTFFVSKLAKYIEYKFQNTGKLLSNIGLNTNLILCVHLFDLDCIGSVLFSNGPALLIFRVITDIGIAFAIGKFFKRTKQLLYER